MTDHEHPNNSEGKAAPNRLAVMLVQHGLLSTAQIQAAQALEEDLATTLVDLGFLTEDQLTAFFVKAMKIPRLGLQDYQIDLETLKIVPQELCLQHRLLPIDLLGKNLTLAMVNPLDDEALDRVRTVCSNYRIKAFHCTRTDFELVSGRLFQEKKNSENGAGDMSLGSLGLKPSTAPKKQAAESISPPGNGGDAQATMLFDSKIPAPKRPAAPMRSCLICLDGWELGKEVEITADTHIIGRSPKADTTINSPLISREHARITRDTGHGQETFVINDMKSSNGTFVNNVPLTTTILRHGDRILVGDVLFKFVLLDEIEARFHQDVHRLYSIHKDTGLLPADAWRKELARALAAAPTTPLTTCLIEIDGLERIRQAHGHIAGVIVLNDISDMLGMHLEKTDLPGDYGPGRIAVLLEGKPIEAAFPILEDLRRTVEAHAFHHKDTQFQCTISIGIGVVTVAGTQPEAIITQLEAALASAIEGGHNQTCVAQ